MAHAHICSQPKQTNQVQNNQIKCKTTRQSNLCIKIKCNTRRHQVQHKNASSATQECNLCNTTMNLCTDPCANPHGLGCSCALSLFLWTHMHCLVFVLVHPHLFPCPFALDLFVLPSFGLVRSWRVLDGIASVGVC